ncbi:Uncharacterized protein PHSC3_000326 [Chlamydiales bacterium STE3]|nr:Uncharacterized protein PHSC3_000326 [Chlamydiales bacterium STE3]
MSHNYYFNVSLNSQTFSIYETTKKSQKRHNAIETLEKIEKALKENLKCSSISAQGIQMKKAEAFQLLQAKATAIRNGYDQKQSKLCWLWRKIFSRKKQVDAVHKRIAGLTLRTKNALPILHDDAINEVLKFLPIDDLKRFREVNAHAKAHADLALKDAARKLGYKGKKIGKAKRYLKILSHNLHTLSQQDWKYGINGNNLFKNLIVYVNGKISIEESLNHLKQLSIDDLVKLFAQNVPLQHLKKTILTPPISRGETFTDLQSTKLALYIAVRIRSCSIFIDAWSKY